MFGRNLMQKEIELSGRGSGTLRFITPEIREQAIRAVGTSR